MNDRFEGGREPRIVTHTNMNMGHYPNNRPAVEETNVMVTLEDAAKPGRIARMKTYAKENPVQASLIAVGTVAGAYAGYKYLIKPGIKKLKGKFCKKDKANEETEAVEVAEVIVEQPVEQKKAGNKK